MKRFLFISFLFLTTICSAQPNTYFWSLLNSDNGSPPPPPTRQGLIFESTTVDVNFQQPIATQIGPSWSNLQSCCVYSVIDSNAIRYGTNSIRFLLNKSDPIVSNRHRSEITLPSDVGGYIERWYGYSFYLGNNYAPDDQPEIIWQFHQENPNGSPPFAIYLRSGYFEVLRTISPNIDGGWEVRPPFDSRYPRMQLNGADLFATPNTWWDLVMHIKWTDQNDGYIQIWMNNQLVFERLNTLTNYTQGAGEAGNYMKLGIYKWTFPNTLCNCTQRLMITNGFRIGSAASSFFSVSPGAY